MDALSLLSGDPQAFRDTVWASKVHLHRADPADLVGLLSLDDVDELLTSRALRTPALRVVRDGSVVPAAQFTRSATIAGTPLTGLVDATRVLDMYRNGATLVLQGLHRYWPPLTQLVRDLELALGHPCQANAYLTPPASQGFARHSDTHDVFVFQTHGRKLWEVVDDGEVLEVLLEPGLVMYLPHGTPHSARSEEDSSLHVTVGINQVTWREVLRKVTDRVLADRRYDASVPASYLDSPELLVRGLADQLSALAKGVETLDADEVAGECVSRFLSDRTPLLRGLLKDLVRLDRLDDATVVLRRPTTVCVLKSGPEKLTVLLGDRQLRVPLRLEDPMTFVRDHQTFAIGELAPWLDRESRLVLVRRLVREGLLRTTQ